MGTLIVGLILLIIVAAIVRSMIKGKKNGKSILGVASIGLGREMDFCAHVPELAPEITSSLGFCMR